MSLKPTPSLKKMSLKVRVHHGRGVICWCLPICVSVCLCFGKSWIPFDQMDQFGRNFQGLFGWCPVAIGWVVPIPSSYPVGLGLHPVLSPVVYLLCGCLCYWGMTYNFRKHFTRQTNKWERIFIFCPRPTKEKIFQSQIEGFDYSLDEIKH